MCMSCDVANPLLGTYSVDILHTNPGTEPTSFALQTDSLPTEPPGKSFVSLGRFIPRYSILYDAMVNGIFS